jgi:hypothetical protein
MNGTQNYLIDSSIWILTYRRQPPESIARRVETLVRGKLAATNAVIQMELLIGCRTRDEFDLVRSNLGGVLELEMLRSTWDQATEFGYSLRRKGVTVSLPDLLIAASAVEYSAVLVHADNDFDLIAKHTDLRVESYTESSV